MAEDKIESQIDITIPEISVSIDDNYNETELDMTKNISPDRSLKFGNEFTETSARNQDMIKNASPDHCVFEWDKHFGYCDRLDVLLLIMGLVTAVISGAAIPIILPISVYFCCVGVAAFIFSCIHSFCFNIAAQRQMKRIHTRFFRSILQQDISWFDTHKTGELSARFSHDMDVIYEGLGDKVSQMIQWLWTFIFSFVIAFISSWKLALAVIPFCFMVVVAGGFMTRWVQKLAKEESECYAKAGSIAEEIY
ncbi:hypothetical protein KUTeg_008439 [Tegillarca granosa]|uniref:ABC transmembrane type-1 domain-containing protein n=1 Tax=Tegillarca granosa TaxID=220873 RepID=A0ABQ9F946_TEGGR|nr:hypothetical protein KUTeg_008439 [Tegillarca granosa]